MYSLLNIIRVIKPRRPKWARRIARMEKRRDAYSVLVGKSETRRPRVRYRSRWKDNIKMDLREMGWHGLDRSGSG